MRGFQELVRDFTKGHEALIAGRPKAEPELEYEVYLADRWDPQTSHSTVLYTGSLEQCEDYREANRRPNCLRYQEPAIRPTGKSLELV